MIEDAMQAATDVARAQMPTGVVAAWALAGVIAAAVLFATVRRPDFHARIGGSLLILGAVAGALLWSALRPPVRYFKQVDEVLAERDAIRSRRHDLQVHGFVVPGSLEQRLGKDEFRFRIQAGERSGSPTRGDRGALHRPPPRRRSSRDATGAATVSTGAGDCARHAGRGRTARRDSRRIHREATGGLTTMWTLGDLLEGAARFVRETGAPHIAALWALGAFLVAAVLIRRRQDDFGWKLGSSLLAFGGAAGALFWWSLQPGANYYLFVDEAVAKTQAIRMRRAPVRVHGCVVSRSLEQRPGTDDYRFQLESRPDRPPAVIQARYTGSLPDAFRPGIEIVASGALAGDGSLDVIPDGIMLKCPSKYDGPAPPVFDCAPRRR